MKAGLFFVLVSCALAPAVHAGLDEQLAAECGSAVCVLADSGLPVREYNPEEIRPPASMVKLMLMLMVCEGIQEEKWALDTPIPVSRNAESMGGSQVYLKEGEDWKLATCWGRSASLPRTTPPWPSPKACGKPRKTTWRL